MTEQEMPTKALWGQYAFYSREMVKFLKQDDIDMFLTLRDRLIEIYDELERTPKDGYTDTVEGKALIREMQSNLQFMQLAVQRWLNSATQKRAVSDAYGGYTIPGAGALRDWNG